MKEIDQTLDAGDVFFGLNEPFFSPEELQRCCDFLGVESFYLDCTVNSSKRLFEYPSELIDEFGQQHQRTYDFISKRFNFDLNYRNEAIGALTKD